MCVFSRERSRAALLIVSLSLIGGTGCITASIVSSAQQQNAQRANLRTKLQASMSPVDIQTAQAKMTQLRQAATALEEQYPAPPDQTRPDYDT